VTADTVYLLTCSKDDKHKKPLLDSVCGGHHLTPHFGKGKRTLGEKKKKRVVANVNSKINIAFFFKKKKFCPERDGTVSKIEWSEAKREWVNLRNLWKTAKDISEMCVTGQHTVTPSSL
jgi:hypothetical protein